MKPIKILSRRLCEKPMKYSRSRTNSESGGGENGRGKRVQGDRDEYPGVAFIVGTHPSTGKPDKIFYISYYRGGKRKHEKAGRASIDGMTAAKANAIRTLRMEGKEVSVSSPRLAPRKEDPGILDGVPGFFLFKTAWGTRTPTGFPTTPSRWRCLHGVCSPFGSSFQNP